MYVSTLSKKINNDLSVMYLLHPSITSHLNSIVTIVNGYFAEEDGRVMTLSGSLVNNEGEVNFIIFHACFKIQSLIS